jgi:hypothetical protein
MGLCLCSQWLFWSEPGWYVFNLSFIMKLFPFQEAFKSGSSVCPHRKFLCFDFPKKEISLRSEPSICLWAELFQETLAAESWKHPWPSGCRDKQLGPLSGGGDPTKTDQVHLFLPAIHSLAPLPSLTAWVTQGGTQDLSCHEVRGRATSTGTQQTLSHKSSPSPQAAQGNCNLLGFSQTWHFCRKDHSISNEQGTRKERKKKSKLQSLKHVS